MMELVKPCGDSVLGLPASAGTGMIGYSADETYRFIAHLSSKLNVHALTVAELKTSLDPPKAALVGEFLTQCFYIFYENQSNRN